MAMWEIQHNNADEDCLKTLILQETLETRCEHTFVHKSWMCKKQTSVSHSSTESESISLDASPRLLDRIINLDSKIQIKYVDTRNQVADILTKGNFTRDEWDHLLCFFKNISHFSFTDCSEVKKGCQSKTETNINANDFITNCYATI